VGRVLTDEPRTYVLVGDDSVSDPLPDVSEDARARFFRAWDYADELRRVRNVQKREESQDDADELAHTIDELTSGDGV